MTSLIVTDVDATIQRAYHDTRPVLTQATEQLIGQSLIGLFATGDQPRLRQLTREIKKDVKQARAQLEKLGLPALHVRMTIVPVFGGHGALVGFHWLLHRDAAPRSQASVEL